MSNWETKRKEILKRDNYTCQRCGQFNPELGQVQFYDDVSGDIEIHEYENSPNTFYSNYLISQSKTGYNFNINFGDCWPIFPIMQVHHKKYVDGKESWDYGNDALITLCKKCHYNLHLSESIPVFSRENKLLEEKILKPIDEGSGRKHKFEEWTFIKIDGRGEYSISNINPTITMLLFEDENPELALQKGEKVLDKFIRQFFPRYIQSLK